MGWTTFPSRFSFWLSFLFFPQNLHFESLSFCFLQHKKHSMSCATENTKTTDILYNNHNNEQHVDSLLPTEKLPFDIWNDIIIYLSLRERLRCTQVCKTWHSYFFSLSNMWAEFSLKDVKHCTNLAHDLAPYEINGKHIRKVEMYPGEHSRLC